MEVALGLIAGLFLGMLHDLFRQKLDRRRRNEERSEKAAEELIALLDDARVPFKDAYRLDADVNDEAVTVRVGRIRQKSLLIADDAIRERIELVAEVLENYHGAQQLTGDSPWRIAVVAWEDGRQALRTFLASQPLPASSKELSAYKGSIDEDREIWEQHMKEEAERRRHRAEG